MAEMGGGFGIGIQACCFLASHDIVFKRPNILCSIKMMREQGGELLDPIPVEFFHNFTNLAVKLYTFLEKDRFVCSFLDEYMAEHVFLAGWLDQTHFPQVLNLRIKITIQVGHSF